MGTKRWEHTVREKHYEVNLGSLKDIVHLYPRYEFNDVEKAEWAKPAKKRDYSKFTEEGLREIERRREFARRYYTSPTPKWGRKLQRIVTKLDNIEDFISTGVGIGVVALIVAPELAPILIPALAAGEIASTSFNVAEAALSLPLGPMGVKRAVGYLADAVALNLRGIFSIGKWLKRLEEAVRLAKIGEAWKPFTAAISKRGWFGLALEALQSTDNLFGVGLCLGPIMGAISDYMFGIIRTIMGENATIPDPKKHEEANEELNRLIPGVDAYYHGSASCIGPCRAFRAYADIAEILTSQMVLTGEELLRLLVALNKASQVISKWLEIADCDEMFDVIIQLDSRPEGPVKPETKGILELEGIDPNVVQMPPCSIEGEVKTVLEEVVSHSAEQPKRAYALLDEYENCLEKQACYQLIQSQRQFLCPIVGSPPGDLTLHHDLETIAAEQLFHHSIFPPDGSTRADLDKMINQIVLDYKALGEVRWLTKEELEFEARWVWGSYQTTPTRPWPGIGTELPPEALALIEGS